MSDTATLLTPGVLVTLVNAATATGTGASLLFQVNRTNNAGTDRILEYGVCGNSPTTATITLLASYDGGNTFVTVTNQSALNVVTSPQGYFNINPGVMYQIDVETFDGDPLIIRGAVS